MKRCAALLMTAGLAFGASACGGGDDGGDVTAADIKKTLIDEAELDEEMADCVANAITAEYGENSNVLKELTKADPDVSSDVQDKVIELMTNCALGE